MTLDLGKVIQDVHRHCAGPKDCPLTMAVEDLAMPVPEPLNWTKAVIARDAISLSLHCNPADCCVRPFLEQILDTTAPEGAEG